LLWLAKTLLPQTQQINAIIGARTAVDLLYLSRFEQLARQSNQLVVTSATEDGSAGVQGRVTDALLPLLAEARLDAIFACGPHGMLAALQKVGENHAIPCQLSWEAYMRCGIGICGACEHEGSVLCLDGPVLKYPAQ
jgi:dihydroorotate dehydrogenase electron transfer subunit